MGNGTTNWYDAVSEENDTIDEVLSKTALANGMSYASSGNVITLNGKTTTEIGGTNSYIGGEDPFKTSGTTGKIVKSIWMVCGWDGSKWNVLSNLSVVYGTKQLALGFYPEDGSVLPVETPNHRSSWTMVRGDAEQTGHQEDVVLSEKEAKVDWSVSRGGSSGVYASALYVEDLVFIKFGASGSGLDPVVRCYEQNANMTLAWEFEYSGDSAYETTTPVIIGEFIYIPGAAGYIYKIPWKIGPGTDNANVTSFGGISINDPALTSIPNETGAVLTGFSYNVGASSLVYDSGAIFANACNGMVYCFDLDLNLIWSRQMGGHNYYVSPTVCGDHVFSGALNGHVYVLNKNDGSIAASEKVYTRSIQGQEYGNVAAVSVIDQGSKYTLMFSVSDGLGMGSTIGGIGVYDFNLASKALTKVSLIADRDTLGLTGNYLISMDSTDFKGVYFTSTKGLFKMDVDGKYDVLNIDIYSIKAPPLLVNGSSIYLVSYQPSKPVYEMALDGRILSEWVPKTTVNNYGMSPILFVNGMFFFGNDSGLIAGSGTLPDYVPPEPAQGLEIWQIILMIFALILTIIAIIYVILRFVKKIERPFSYLRQKASNYVSSDELKHNTRNKHRLLIVMIFGIVLTIAIFMVNLCVGPTATLSLGEMLSALGGAISKGGEGLDYNELMVYESRLPRTLAALAVGIGLSIAGSMYQAIIRNPLVDPYIMGVSAGAGTAAVAVIAFDFTFFGLFSAHSIYLTAFTAIIGGIIAFLATMFIAEKAGGSSLNYVLGGVVIGLAFSAIQTLMLSMSGQRVSNALSWLFGSFANIGWNEVWLIVFPAIALALVPLIWAKEFNLVLLGEDQAQQMGLNVRRFNRTMLILASVLTSICVAFVGIIGFVGLVIPHLCRMILGGDHRLVLPASIALGGALMMIADLASRMVYLGQELPVGAITTIIGVPVFAYLLIKRGRMYDG